MTKLVIVGFLIAHGLVHLAIAAPPPGPHAPFDPGRSWALAIGGTHVSAMRGVGIALAALSALAYLAAGVGIATGAAWWTTATTVAAGVSLAHLVLFFNPWLSAGVLIDAGVLWAVSTGWLAARVGL